MIIRYIKDGMVMQTCWIAHAKNMVIAVEYQMPCAIARKENKLSQRQNCRYQRGYSKDVNRVRLCPKKDLPLIL